MTKAVRDLVKFAEELEQKMEEAPQTMRSPESAPVDAWEGVHGQRHIANQFVDDLQNIMDAAPQAIAYLKKELNESYPKSPKLLPVKYYSSAEFLSNFINHIAKL
jgi:cytochrome c556